MKKLACALLAVCLLAAAAPGLADSFDLSVVRENSNMLTINVDSDRDCAFVETALTAKERSFVHKYESDYLYSTTKFDMLVLNYFESTAYPVFRLLVSYSADEYLYITSVRFIFNGKSYTFSDVSSSESRIKDEYGASENLLIVFGMDNLEFLADLQGYANGIIGDDIDLDKLDEHPVTMVLHGTEDVTVTLGKGFMSDCLVMTSIFFKCGGLNYLNKAHPTPMKVATAP